MKLILCSRWTNRLLLASSLHWQFVLIQSSGAPRCCVSTPPRDHLSIKRCGRDFSFLPSSLLSGNHRGWMYFAGTDYYVNQRNQELNVANKQHLHFHSCPEELVTTGGAPVQSVGLFCSISLINGVSVLLRDTSGQTLADSRVYWCQRSSRRSHCQTGNETCHWIKVTSLKILITRERTGGNLEIVLQVCNYCSQSCDWRTNQPAFTNSSFLLFEVTPLHPVSLTGDIPIGGRFVCYYTTLSSDVVMMMMMEIPLNVPSVVLMVCSLDLFMDVFLACLFAAPAPQQRTFVVCCFYCCCMTLMERCFSISGCQTFSKRADWRDESQTAETKRHRKNSRKNTSLLSL